MPHHDERPAIDALTALRILRDKILPQAQNKRLNDFNVRLRVHDAVIGRLAQIADSDSFGAREPQPCSLRRADGEPGRSGCALVVLANRRPTAACRRVPRHAPWPPAPDSW